MFTSSLDLYSLRLMLSTKKRQCPVSFHSSPAEVGNGNSFDGLQHIPHTWGALVIKSGKGKFTILLWNWGFISLIFLRWLCCLLYHKCSGTDWSTSESSSKSFKLKRKSRNIFFCPANWVNIYSRELISVMAENNAVSEVLSAVQFFGFECVCGGVVVLLLLFCLQVFLCDFFCGLCLRFFVWFLCVCCVCFFCSSGSAFTCFYGI